VWAIRQHGILTFYAMIANTRSPLHKSTQPNHLEIPNCWGEIVPRLGIPDSEVLRVRYRYEHSRTTDDA
jgi:hypothetical protein